MREAHAKAGVGERVERAIQGEFAQQIALVQPGAEAVGDELELVLTGEGCVVDLVSGQVDANRRECALLESEDAARAKLHVDLAGVGGAGVAEPGGVRGALLAAIVKQALEIAFESQRQRSLVLE